MPGLQDRFWSKVDRRNDDECWEWTASKLQSGYGQFRYDERVVGAHRAAYRLTKGNPGEDSVLHTCDNRACVNPNHLYLGDQQDNIDDAVERGRMAIDSDNAASKLTERDVGYIKWALDNLDVTHNELAKAKGVHTETVGAIAREETWTHVELNEPGEL